jgi:hypothetical protein
MSTDFRKVLVKDDRLIVSDQVSYAVLKGGQNMTAQQFNAIGSNFTSSINFNLQIPSQETIVSRNVLMKGTLEFSITGATQPSAAAASDQVSGLNFLFHYGGTDCFGPMVFNQLITTQQYTINNTTVSQNTRDILAVILRIHDKRWLARYNGMTPIMYDTYSKLPGMVFAGTLLNVINNPAGGFPNNGMDNDLLTRGSFPLKSLIPADAGLPNYSPQNGPGAGALRTITVQVEVTEPVLISPFTFAGDDSCGFYGIQNLSAVINLDQSANTAIRFFNSINRHVAPPVVRLVQVIKPQLLFQLLTPHASDMLPARNVVPYYELPRYIQTCPAFPEQATQVITSQSLQLNMIPDKLIISVGKPVSARTCADGDAWLSISGITINWNNTSGILSSATAQDLWRMSVENGSNQSWHEFLGYGQNFPNAITSSAGAGALTYSTLCGSVLILEFGKDIQLSEDYYAPGSLGNFQLQFNVTVTNASQGAAAAGDYQLLTIIQNSGVFSIERGVSSSYLGVLTKSDVLEASRQEATSYSNGLRMVGGANSQFGRLKANLGKIGKGESGGMTNGMGKSKKSSKVGSFGGLEDRY